ncbi:dephospho-CoA kinase [Candidatus Viridilinea mediisalina]|uniref:Dephospho-CoA kinase n=1 Tax=Candidatus Viridilinea mediisalina TaxID=2024553 RepID=A0A2A6RHD2_9CHLR|nr:dephospho-CoA kinase [Candidatus Viridilinea mediisalina]PDW02306.1 dephospho-CoA kinase [Candidatus Viridilinea mediisalina]
MTNAIPYLIGLTGGIACGKSTVVAMLASLGARTIDADRVTHKLQQPGTPVFRQIVASFGNTVLAPTGALDRRKLGAIVFSDPEKLRQLEQIVHPAVRTEIRTFIAEVGRSGGYATRLGRLSRPVVVLDAIKLIESGWVAECNQVWVITSEHTIQIERLIANRGMSRAEAERRIAAQMAPAERLAHAHVVIDNSGDQQATRAQVEAAWQQVLQVNAAS